MIGARTVALTITTTAAGGIWVQLWQQEHRRVVLPIFISNKRQSTGVPRKTDRSRNKPATRHKHRNVRFIKLFY